MNSGTFNEIFNNPKLPSFPSRLQLSPQSSRIPVQLSPQSSRIPDNHSLILSSSRPLVLSFQNQRSPLFSRSPGSFVFVSYLSGRKWVSEDIAEAVLEHDNRVTDHRLKTNYELTSFLGGDIDNAIQACASLEQQELLEELAESVGAPAG